MHPGGAGTFGTSAAGSSSMVGPAEQLRALDWHAEKGVWHGGPAGQ